jgi:hypothetical protein
MEIKLPVCRLSASRKHAACIAPVTDDLVRGTEIALFHGAGLRASPYLPEVHFASEKKSNLCDRAERLTLETHLRQL